MIGLVVVTHGRLAEEFVKAAFHVVGPQPNIVSICIGEDDDMELRRDDILKAAQTVDGGGGTIILTDMFGGTPSNLAISIMDKVKAEVIAGVNLPMLIKLAPEQYRQETDMPELVNSAYTTGRKYIHVASWALSEEKAD
ncbi:MAG: PTS sugar transporter subunit IIA [bacterium]